MRPFNFFTAPPSIPPDTYSQGDMSTDGQWDGIVGRVSAQRLSSASLPVPAIRLDFHAVVGGDQSDDFLLGLADKDLSEFVVVGHTRTPTINPGTANIHYPLTRIG